MSDDEKRSAISEIMGRHSATGAAAFAGGEVLPRRYATFVIDFAICEPGVFPQDFTLTLRSLRSDEETRAIDNAQQAMEIGSAMAKASVFQYNGEQLTSVERDWLWEAIGSGGRNVVASMYARVGMAPQEALGKAMKSLSVS